MKNNLFSLLTHPIIQILSFNWILVGSPYFGGPYLFFVVGAATQFEWFAVLGVAGVFLLAVCVFLKNWLLQIAGSICCLSSIAIFFFNSSYENALITLGDWLALLTLVFFVLIHTLTLYKLFRWKNYSNY
ncbi:MAG TPA: hypothetical protein DHW64_10960 [Chitinophagaceae bacterium]|nr:hypothetical protein [Chitinophagaceae bacterium]